MMLYDVLWCCMMLYDVIAVDFIPELFVFQLNAKLKPSYIPRCGIFITGFTGNTVELCSLGTFSCRAVNTLNKIYTSRKQENTISDKNGCKKF